MAYPLENKRYQHQGQKLKNRGRAERGLGIFDFHFLLLGCDGKPILVLYPWPQIATRRRRCEVRVWTLRATLSRKIVNLRAPQQHTS